MRDHKPKAMSQRAMVLWFAFLEALVLIPLVIYLAIYK